jgi:hypothetical protein
MIKPQSKLQNAEFENREMNTGLGRADLISQGKIPSKIAIGNDISRMRMLLGLNEFPQTPFLIGIWGFYCYVFCL